MANNESAIRRVLFHEVTVIFAVVTVVLSVAIFVYDIKLELQELGGKVHVIETNHLEHIRGSLDRLEENLIKQQEDVKLLHNSVIRLNILLDQLSE
ncbi:MAG: hypothetical protein HN402_07795 [Candidatus Scalindua sp.]|jgi:hypothetical protein|nr:hypothetical protein [Candidatus Scalindua sp.]MBT6757342.1 hypothetical protein [Candidatus Jacksonbacteria bacterium]